MVVVVSGGHRSPIFFVNPKLFSRNLVSKSARYGSYTSPLKFQSKVSEERCRILVENVGWSPLVINNNY